jgi:predicted small secreted protein
VRAATRKRSTVRSLAAVVVAALVLAACGGSSGVTPAAYVKSMCTALGNWKTDVQSAGSKLQSSGAQSATRPVAKRDYQTFVSALVTATRRAANALHAAGEPSVGDGKRIASGLARAFDQATVKLAQAQSQAKSIPTGSASAFQLGASSVTTQIRSALQGIAGVAPSQSAPLRSAAAKDPACQVLRG